MAATGTFPRNVAGKTLLRKDILKFFMKNKALFPKLKNIFVKLKFYIFADSHAYGRKIYSTDLQ